MRGVYGDFDEDIERFQSRLGDWDWGFFQSIRSDLLVFGWKAGPGATLPTH